MTEEFELLEEFFPLTNNYETIEKSNLPIGSLSTLKIGEEIYQTSSAMNVFEKNKKENEQYILDGYVITDKNNNPLAATFTTGVTLDGLAKQYQINLEDISYNIRKHYSDIKGNVLGWTLYQ